jgi:spoIIIJ-associated protein
MIIEGKTLEEAISSGLKELNATENETEIKIIEEPTKGLFGKLKGKAVIEINLKAEGEQKAVIFIQELLNKLDFNAKATLTSDGENPVIDIIAEKSSEIIGYRGEVLDALQTLAGAIVNTGRKDYIKLAVDCENYRQKRKETLINLAHKLEAKATEIRREVILEPMNPFERRIIHTALAESQTVSTKSDGVEPNRFVVIVPNDKDEYSRPYNAGRQNKDGNKRNHKDRGDKRGFRGSRDFSRKSSGQEQRKKSSLSFGTYLGNSLKDN